jgi:hypothetical protein
VRLPGAIATQYNAEHWLATYVFAATHKLTGGSQLSGFVLGGDVIGQGEEVRMFHD